MRVSEIMTRAVKTCRECDSLDLPARLMRENDIGAVVVIDERGRATAMITDRDVCMAAHAHGQSLREIPVRFGMSRTLHTCSEADVVAAAEKTMQAHRVRRLPVVNADSKLVGIVSLDDIAKAAVQQRQCIRHEVSDEEIGHTLAEICNPTPLVPATVHGETLREPEASRPTNPRRKKSTT